MKFGVLYYYGITNNMIQWAEVVDAKNIRKAIEETDRNLEMNVVFPLNKRNKNILKQLLKN